MIAQERLEAIVRNLLIDGLDANAIAKRTGVPIIRVQRIVHLLNGRDPDEAARETRQKKRQADRQIFGTSLGALRQPGPNSRRTSDGRR
jgi:hypothetical protein